MRRSRTLLGASAAMTALALAACGSALSPDEVQRANGSYTLVPVLSPADSGAAQPVSGSGSAPTPQSTAPQAVGPAASASRAPGSRSQSSGSAAANGRAAAGAPASAGDCAGFTNGKGITDKQITIGEVADLSGAVGGLFKSAQDATKAFVAYFNATVPGGICGRSLALVTEDSQTSDGGDQAAAIDVCGKAFALVGSMSAFDGGGAATTASCGLPDLRVSGVTAARFRSPTTYSSYSIAPNLVPAVEPETFKRLFPGVQDAAAMIYLTAGSAVSNGQSFKAAYTKAGFTFVMPDQAVDPATVSYDGYVNAMYAKKVRYIHYTGAYQDGVKLQRAIATRKAGDPSWNPIVVMDSVAYDPGFAASGGSAVEGTVSWTSSGLFEAPTDELNLYTQWLARVSPGSPPTFFGQYAWSAARLFTDKAVALGGKLNRQSLLEALAATHDWTAHGMHTPSDVGGHRTPNCVAVLQLRGGKWVNVGGGNPYVCGGLIDSGIGN